VTNQDEFPSFATFTGSYELAPPGHVTLQGGIPHSETRQTARRRQTVRTWRKTRWQLTSGFCEKAFVSGLPVLPAVGFGQGLMAARQRRRQWKRLVLNLNTSELVATCSEKSSLTAFPSFRFGGATAYLVAMRMF